MNVLGAILLMIGGGGTALYLLGREQNKLTSVDGLARLLAIAAENIKNFAMPAREILLSCGRELLLECSYDERLSMPESFSDMLYGCDICDSAANEIFTEFCESFGGSQRSDAAARCEYYAEQMRRRSEELHSGASGRKKTVLCLCASITLIVLILLL